MTFVPESRREGHTGAARGEIARLLLALAAAAAALSPASCAESASTETEGSLAECLHLHAANPQSQRIGFWTGKEGEDFGEFTSNSTSGWKLQNAMLFHALDPVEETAEWTVLCVGLVDTTSYTYEEGQGYPIAWATLHTKRSVAAGLVRLRTRCWLEFKHFGGCDPEFTPMPYVRNLPLYHHSPLEEQFWSNLTIEGMDIKPSWIWKINTQTNKGSIDPNWVYKMRIPSLEVLKILGNNWKMPDKILDKMPNIINLDLSYNNLEIVPEGMFNHMPSLDKIILGHNNISKYPSSVSNLTKLWLLDLTNPIGNATLSIADEDVEMLPKSLRTLGLENTKLLANITNFFLLPNLVFLNLSGCAVGFINDRQSVNNTSKLKTIDLSYNELEVLPPNIFSAMPELQKLIVSNNNLQVWPGELLNKNSLTSFDLSHNNISELTYNTFIYLEKLQILDVSWNKIENISGVLFHKTPELKKLDLSYNKIVLLPDTLFSYIPQVEIINLSNNMLKEVPNLWDTDLKSLDLSHNDLTEFRNNMSKIEKVDLSYNNMRTLNVSSAVQKVNVSFNEISYISPVMWTNIIQLKEIDVGGNGFECCRFGNRTFLNEKHQTQIQNLGTVDPLTCSVNQTSPKILLQTFVYNETECIPLEMNEVLTPFGIAVVLPLTVLILTVGLVAVMMYVYRFELTYVSHLFRMKKIGAETDEQRYKTCVYDAFVCYSAKNFEWVVGTLLPGLEGGPEGYRLCVHDRDFALGAGINRNIVASLEKSRKVIFVLSNDFISSKWCQWELEMANHKMFEEKRNYIILVELERIPRRTLPRHLRYLMDRTTYLEWPEAAAAAAKGTTAAAGPKAEAQAQARRLHACFRRLREALGDSLHQRTGRDNGGFFTVLDAP